MTTFQKAKNRIFAKGLTHDFCQKMQNFPFLFWEQNEPRNNVSLCARCKRNYLTIKKITTFQNAKNDNFPKG